MARTVENRTDEKTENLISTIKASLLCYLQWSMSSQLF